MTYSDAQESLLLAEWLHIIYSFFGICDKLIVNALLLTQNMIIATFY